MTMANDPDRAAGQALLGGVTWASLSQDKSGLVLHSQPSVDGTGEFAGAVDVEMRSGWYRLSIEPLPGKPEPVDTEEQQAIASIMAAAGAPVSEVTTLQRIRMAVQVLRTPGSSLESIGAGVHGHCEAVCTDLIATVFEHILGDCDPATCASSEHRHG